MKIKHFIIGTITLLILDIAQSSYVSSEQTIDYGDSIKTFGFTNTRLNSLKTSLSSYHDFKEVLIPELQGFDYLRGQPLFISASDWKKHTGEESSGKIVLASENAITFVDIDKLDVKKVKVTGHRLFNNTGLIDSKNGLMYFTNSKGLSAFSFSGKLVDHKDLPWGKIIKEKYPSYSGKGVFCNTALTLFKDAIFLGCSGKNFDDKKMTPAYGSIKGGSGFVAKIFLNTENKSFSKKYPNIFFTNKKTKNPMSSFNGGIWLAGGGLSVDEERETIVSVAGNGPYIPSEDNFSCSAFKIHSSNIEALYKSSDKDKGYVGSALEGTQECMFTNYEWASGQVALAKVNNEMTGFAAGKLGRVSAFNVREMIGGKVDLLEQVDINTSPMPAYGMGNYGSLSVLNKGSEAMIMHVGLTDQAFYMNISGSEKTYDEIQKIEKVKQGKIKFTGKKCLGFALKNGGVNEREIAFLYSGPYFKHTFLTDVDSKLFSSLTGFKNKPYIYHEWYDELDRFHPVFYHMKSDGHFLTKKSTIPKGYRLKDANSHRWGGHVSLREFSDKNFRDTRTKATAFYESSERNYFLVNESDEWNCRTDNKNLIPMYKHYLTYKGDLENLRGWRLHLIKYINKKFKKDVVYTHQYSSSMPWRSSVSSSLMTYNDENKENLAFVPLRVVGDNSRGAIEIIDLKRKKKVQRLLLRSPMKFSTPLLVGDKLILSSDSGGFKGPVYIFKAEISLFNKIIKNSWFSFLW